MQRNAAGKRGVARPTKSCLVPSVCTLSQLAYARFVKYQFHLRSMKVTLSTILESGVFVVLQKDSSLRMILDARQNGGSDSATPRWVS